MIRHVWTVLCSRAVFDQESNNVSLINILEQVNLPPDVTLPHQLHVNIDIVSLWVKEVDDEPIQGKGKLVINRPTGEELGNVELSIDLTRTHHHRTKINLPSIPVTEAGEYEFAIEMMGEDGEWQTVARVPLTITSRVPAENQERPTP